MGWGLGGCSGCAQMLVVEGGGWNVATDFWDNHSTVQRPQEQQQVVTGGVWGCA